MKKIIYCTLFLTLALAAAGCSDWLTVQPKSEVSRDDLFKAPAGFESALNGVYHLMRTTHNPDELPRYNDYMANTWYAGEDNTSWAGQLAHANYRATYADQTLGNAFLNLYNAIANVNEIIAQLDKRGESVLSVLDYKRIRGEAKGLRAFLHFEIMKIWGPMPTSPSSTAAYLPYVTVTSVKEADLPYHRYADYMEKLLADLTEAQQMLAESDYILTYSNEELNNWGMWRQNKMNIFAVIATRARVHLWMGQKESAALYAKMVVDAVNEDGKAKFTLATSADVTSNKLYFTEHVFGIHTEKYEDIHLSSGARSNFQLAACFEELYATTDENYKNDFRAGAAMWQIYSNSSLLNGQGASVWATTRYGGMGEDSPTVPMSYPVIRLSEMYLILAECLPVDQANEYYHTYLVSRGIPGAMHLTADNRTDVLMREYMKEFISEGQMFAFYKRNAVRQTLWTDYVSGADVYEVPLPTRQLNEIE